MANHHFSAKRANLVKWPRHRNLLGRVVRHGGRCRTLSFGLGSGLLLSSGLAHSLATDDERFHQNGRVVVRLLLGSPSFHFLHLLVQPLTTFALLDLLRFVTLPLAFGLLGIAAFREPVSSHDLPKTSTHGYLQPRECDQFAAVSPYCLACLTPLQYPAWNQASNKRRVGSSAQLGKGGRGA
jgi:hypothetical protein